MLCELRGATRTNEKRHVASRLQQTSTEIAADRARSNNKNSHVTRTLSTIRGAARRGLRNGRDQHECSEDDEMHGALQHRCAPGAEVKAAIYRVRMSSVI